VARLAARQKAAFGVIASNFALVILSSVIANGLSALGGYFDNDVRLHPPPLLHWCGA